MIKTKKTEDNMELNIQKDGFRDDNTEGYEPAQLADLNRELAALVEPITDDEDAYHAVIKRFSDVVAGR